MLASDSCAVLGEKNSSDVAASIWAHAARSWVGCRVVRLFADVFVVDRTEHAVGGMAMWPVNLFGPADN
ncbi:hypothetical protein [Mycobacterium lepromatosis]|uniref:hypothetical protein n=1 Tax=Mycobacterium lepromatosis TaxID=480418 RepID=UPI000678C6F5|nr:hypothetical protein [Mycobacterium lepromatosis]UKN42110.1 hypothetical protein MLPF_1275 [Mycobacterium lepromatosis]UKN42897.1 hypothetical protein MLPF_2810 [Mycobacterium lepromatosis]